MKKVLLGTSAIALAGAFGAQANAAEFEVRIGGYFEAFAAFASVDVDNTNSEDFDGVDSKQDTEIRFRPRIQLDNGLEIGADIQLEANTSGDTIDESFLYLDGAFGRVLLGSENSAGYLMTYAAPDVTFLNVNSGSTTAFIPYSGTASGLNVGDDVFRRTLGTTFLESGGNNDAQRFTYFTPRFAGFQLGVSYARDGAEDNNAQQNLDGAALRDIVDVGANYLNSFGPIDVGVSGRYGIAFSDAPANALNPNQNDPMLYSAGINLGYNLAGGTVSVGGSFAEQNNAGTDDGTAFDVGVAYETGPWGVSFTYFSGENVNDEAALNAAGNDEELQQYLLGINYALADGVDLNAFGAYVNFEEEVGDAGGAGDDVDGFIIGTGVKISF